ncbi:hypothetical protein Tco_0925396 [Tanacetum coccineum]|uniref:PB1-like domain-containing protein n=1 Tax=Tanacetum coccineum TaxID=301880 RepID=A0ABQ5D7M3_9ASTR
MLCQWRVRKKGQEANPYEDYREFPSVFCLKINHGGTFTPPPMTRYKGGKVNWVDDIDSDTFSIVEVTSMLQELGYENPCMAYYYKKPNSELENGLVELVVDKDVYEMLMYVDKFKVIELYTDHTVKKQHVLTQEPLATIIDVTQPGSSSGNEAEVDVSEDEWLRESLKKLPIKSKKGQQSSRKEVGQSSRNGSGSENGSGSDSGSDSEDSDYFVDEENLIEDVDVDMAEFKRHTDPGVEWLGCKENVLEENEVFELEEVDHEEFDSGSDSDEGVRRKALRKVARMNKAIQGKGERVYKEDFFLGEQFATSKLVKDKVTRVSVEQRRQLSLKKNDKLRVRVVCKGQVPDFANNDMGSVIPFTGDQNGPILQAAHMRTPGSQNPYCQQYAQLRDYCMELKEKNPNTTVKIEVEPPEDPDSEERKFKRIYICLGHLKDGFKAGEGISMLHLKERIHGSGRAKSNILLNNLCEVLNRQLLDGRDKSYYHLLNGMLLEIGSLSGILTMQLPSIWDQQIFGIDTGIPESYCLPVHWLTTWKEMYKFKINPVNGPQAELADENDEVLRKMTKSGCVLLANRFCKHLYAAHGSQQAGVAGHGDAAHGSQQAGVAGHGDAAHGSQQAGVHGSQTTQSTPHR